MMMHSKSTELIQLYLLELQLKENKLSAVMKQNTIRSLAGKQTIMGKTTLHDTYISALQLNP